MNTDTKVEVFLVWDRSRQEHGEAPEHMAVFATEEDAIAYGKKTFEIDVWGDCLIEQWVAGTDIPKDSFLLGDKA